MNISRMYINELAKETNFIKDNIEKVIRLIDILDFINSDIKLNRKLILKGGTAINLTIFNLPRLSVDIDLDYSINYCKEKVLEERMAIKEVLENYLLENDYVITDETREHYALLSLHCSYVNSIGNKDNIKIEINFLDREHILSPVYKEIIILKRKTNKTGNIHKEIIYCGYFLFYSYKNIEVISVEI